MSLRSPPPTFWNGALKRAPQQGTAPLLRSWTSIGPVRLPGSGSARLGPLPLNISLAEPSPPATALHPGRLERLVVEDEPARRVDPAGLPGAGADHPRRRHQRTRVVQAEGIAVGGG